MLCDECGKNPATIRLVSIVAGEKNERNLCAECAAKHNLRPQAVDVGKLLTALIAGAGQTAQTANLTCSACGAKFSQTLKTRRVGCASCYESFRAQISALLQKQQGANAHIGRMPEEENAIDPLEQMRREMEMAVACENFEQAATLRDAIRALSASREGGETHA